MLRMPALIAALLSLTLVSCAAGAGDPGAVGSQAVASQAPLLGKADGSDQADHACAVVLRDLARFPAGADPQVQCVGTACTFVWTGHIDVSMDAFAQAPSVAVLYHRSDDPTWWQVEATPSADGGHVGFYHFGITLNDHLFGPDATADELAGLTIELVPFVRLADGARLFDHNRRPGDFDNYSLDQSTGFALGDNDGTCGVTFGRISFLGTWQNLVNGGALHADGWLGIDYSLDRLPECRGTHNGFPAWDIVANVRFIPGGQVTTGSVRQLQTQNGTPTNDALPLELDVKIPSDATAVEIWFHNFSGAGDSCDAWDSSYGANYRFDVAPRADDPRCLNVETYAGNYGGTPSCLAYTIAAQADATGCEVSVKDFGDGYEGHYGIPFNWVETHLVMRPTQGEVLNAGMLTLYTDQKDGTAHTRTSLGVPTDASTYHTGFSYLAEAPYGVGTWHYAVNAVAFFVDVRRPSGDVVRLWQSHGGANYSWNDAFGAGTTQDGIAYGNIKWANDGNAILESRQACQ
jgi:hypothetical protein